MAVEAVINGMESLGIVASVASLTPVPSSEQLANEVLFLTKRQIHRRDALEIYSHSSRFS